MIGNYLNGKTRHSLRHIFKANDEDMTDYVAITQSIKKRWH